MRYAAHDDTTIYAVADTAEEAIVAAKTDAYGSVHAWNAEASVRPLTGFSASPISDDLAADVEAGGQDGWYITWDTDENGTLVRPSA